MAQSKAALGRLAAELRSEMGLAEDDPFDPYAWGIAYGVPILSLAEVSASERAVRRFAVERPELWSAALIQNGHGQVVVYNAAHSMVRVRSNLAHEVAHIAAEHAMTSAWMTDSGGCGGTSQVHEKEAAELAGAILIPAERAKVHAIKGRNAADLALTYQVSVEMAQWRMRASGGEMIARRSRTKWQSARS